MTPRKKIWIVVTILLLAIAILVVYIKSPKQTIRLTFVDENGSRIVNDAEISKKHNAFWRSIHPKSIKGYVAEKKAISIKNNTKYLLLKYKTKSNNQVNVLKKSKFVATSFQVLGSKVIGRKQVDGGNDILRIIYSNDGKRWKTLATNYPTGAMRDSSMLHVGKWWYVIATDRKIIRSDDLSHWETLNWNDGSTSFRAVWAPEFLMDKYGKVHIACAAMYPNESRFQLFISDFDAKNGTMVGNWQKITGGYLDVNGTSGVIDPHIMVMNNKYYLWCVRRDDTDILLLESADSLTEFSSVDRKFTPQKSNINDAYEAPTTSITKSNQVLLYYDQYRRKGNKFVYYGDHVRKVELDNMKLFPVSPVNANFLVRHMNMVVETH